MISEDEISRRAVEMICERKSDAEIIDALTSLGAPMASAEAGLHRVLANLASEEPFVSARRANTAFLHNTYRLLATIEASADAVDTCADEMSREVFRDRYYKQNRPLLVRGPLRNWSGRATWSPDGLRTAYGDRTVQVMSNRRSGVTEGLPGTEVATDIRFTEFLDIIENSKPTNDIYMVSRNGNLSENLRDAAATLPPLRPFLEDISESAVGCNLWIGPAGTESRLHRDAVNVMLTQLWGSKRIKLISPLDGVYVYSNDNVWSLVDPYDADLSRFPAFARAKVLDVTLNADDSLFIPVGWWHDVRSLTMSISVGFSRFGFLNDFFPKATQKQIH